jgi:sulfate permease, SulP family
MTRALAASRRSRVARTPASAKPGEVGFFDGLPRSADVVAREASEALVLTQAAFHRLRLTHPRLALRFVLDLGRILGERFRASDALAGPVPR